MCNKYFFSQAKRIFVNENTSRWKLLMRFVHKLEESNQHKFSRSIYIRTDSLCRKCSHLVRHHNCLCNDLQHVPQTTRFDECSGRGLRNWMQFKFEAFGDNGICMYRWRLIMLCLVGWCEGFMTVTVSLIRRLLLPNLGMEFDYLLRCQLASQKSPSTLFAIFNLIIFLPSDLVNYCHGYFSSISIGFAFNFAFMQMTSFEAHFHVQKNHSTRPENN